MNINKVSQSINAQTPDFIESNYPLFNKFLEYYYKSQEKTGLGQNILNNFLEYLDIDKLDIAILDGSTSLVEPLTVDSDTIVVESVDSFLTNNGSILIGDEIIYYENVTPAPNIALSPGISYEQVKLKWTSLANPINSFNGSTTTFALLSQDTPIAPPSAQHLIVSVYGEVLIPGIDYSISGTNIIFATAPRTKLPADDEVGTYITFLGGFIDNNVIGVDNLSNSFGDGKTEFKMTRNGISYEPIVDEFVIAVYDNTLLIPKVDFYIDKDLFIFKTAPTNGRFLSIYSVEAPIPSFGSSASAFARVNENGEINNIVVSEFGTQYRYEYPPKVTIQSLSGKGASATTLVNGIESVTLLNGGQGYSDTNPPAVVIESPVEPDSIPAQINATVKNGSITSLTIVSSGSGYTFTPRISFRQPGGAKLNPPTIVDGSISGDVTVSQTGFGYTTTPEIYIDEPTGENPIKASLRAVLTNGEVTSVEVLNAGQGYLTTPRIAVIDPVGASVLETTVDSNGRLVGIELLNGGSGYTDVPSVYVVDNRPNGGTGATASASIFNGRITDINITNFGNGYSVTEPPTIVIQSPPQGKASATVGLNKVTGFTVNKAGSGYTKD